MHIVCRRNLLRFLMRIDHENILLLACTVLAYRQQHRQLPYRAQLRVQASVTDVKRPLILPVVHIIRYIYQRRTAAEVFQTGGYQLIPLICLLVIPHERIPELVMNAVSVLLRYWLRVLHPLLQIRIRQISGGRQACSLIWGQSVIARGIEQDRISVTVISRAA
ncbi:hypothetical protein D3C81_1176960 [compost metagenome]